MKVKFKEAGNPISVVDGVIMVGDPCSRESAHAVPCKTGTWLVESAGYKGQLMATRLRHRELVENSDIQHYPVVVDSGQIAFWTGGVEGMVESVYHGVTTHADLCLSPDMTIDLAWYRMCCALTGGKKYVGSAAGLLAVTSTWHGDGCYTVIACGRIHRGKRFRATELQVIFNQQAEFE